MEKESNPSFDIAHLRVYNRALTAAEVKTLYKIGAVIDRAGGQSAFARLHGIPLRTVQRWYHNDTTPPEWLVKILNSITPDLKEKWK